MAHFASHRLLVAACLVAACSNGDDLPQGSESDYAVDLDEIAPSQTRTDGVQGSRPPPVTTPPPGEGAPGEGEPEEEPAVEPPSAATGCRAPAGVSASPRSIPEALTLINSLPRPTTLACFLESLERPLSIYMTASDLSLQPSPGARSPRTFIVFNPLVISIVPDGEASTVIEFGFRTSMERSIKAEILFPVSQDVTAARLFDRVTRGQDSTECARCHTAEQHTPHEDFPEGVFESDVIPPYASLEVGVDELRAEVSACDPTLEEHRCGILNALFNHGEVQQAPLWLDSPP
jgi:hypothetical protein